MATYLVLDGHSLAYRAWFALQESGMATASGQETQAVYGFVSMTTRLLTDFKPDGMAVAFDRPEPTFRDAIASDYKAGRQATPDPLRSQFELIRQFVSGLGVPVVDAVGFEADDVIGTLATMIRDRGDDVVIVTGDRDAYQLVEDPHVKVLYNRRGVTDYVLYDEAGIFERTGVRPADYALLAAFRGDTSDNLPGVPGVGEKTAAKLVLAHPDIDEIYADVDENTPKLRTSLIEHESQVRQNFRLTPIVRDVPLDIDLDAMGFAAVDREGLGDLFTFLEMRAPRDRLFGVLDAMGHGGVVVDALLETAARPVFVASNTNDATERMSAMASATDPVAVEASFAGLAGRSPIEAIAMTTPSQHETLVVLGGLLAEDDVQDALRSLLTTEPGRVVGHRTKELMRSLLAMGIDVTGLKTDTAVVAYLVDPVEGQVDLEEIASRRGLLIEGVVAPAKGQLGFDLADAVESDGLSAIEQTAKRAEVIGLLGEALEKELEGVGGQSLYDEIERPLVRVLAKMEVCGVGVDVGRLQDINTELTNEAKRLEGEIHAHAGESFNVNSTTQLRTVLYEKLALKPQRKTKTGYSTDAQTLEKLRDEHPIIETLLRYREVEKLRSTYGEGLLAEVAPDGRIHASFNQTVARTGRLSSDQPNLHNIPVRSEDGRRFREAFIPAAGTELLVVDYNQIELRVIAHLSDDPGLVGAFTSGEDIHATTASRVFGVEPADVTCQMRSKAKMISYGLAYGMEAYGLSRRLNIEVGEAATMLDDYFIAFPNVKAYMEQTVIEAKRRGYTETERGRRRYLPELASDNFRVRQAAERQAMNAGIQGLAADIFKIALVRLDGLLEARSLSSRVVLQVHDEVLVEAPFDEHDEVEALTIDAMKNAYPLTVPLEVNLSWGKSWADAK